MVGEGGVGEKKESRKVKKSGFAEAYAKRSLTLRNGTEIVKQGNCCFVISPGIAAADFIALWAVVNNERF